MQFSVFFAGIVSATMIGAANAFPSELSQRSVVSQCVSVNDCCFSTKGSCARQAGSYTEQYIACPRIKYCPELGVSWEDCRADCCSIKGKAGRGCPGK